MKENILYNCSKISKPRNWHGYNTVNYTIYLIQISSFSYALMCVCVFMQFLPSIDSRNHNQDTKLVHNRKENLLGNFFTFPLSTPALPLSAGSHYSILHLYSFVNFQLYQWNHTVRNLLRRTFFPTKHNAIKAHHICCMNQ